MALTLTQSATAVCPRVPASFFASGGQTPYVYSVLPGGAGGTIDASTGGYRAPPGFSSNPRLAFDTIQVMDDDGARATARILVGSPLTLFCEIIQRQMGLAADRVVLWDQKLPQPNDAGLYIAVSMPDCNPIGSSNRFNGDTNETEQFVTMQGTVSIDLISRDGSARDRKEELILALDSDYARFQQNANSFYIGKLSVRFTNLSEIDGPAIPYRYRASTRIQYAYAKAQAAQYFNNFTDTIVTDA